MPVEKHPDSWVAKNRFTEGDEKSYKRVDNVA
jgi:hypothetical protein